MSAKESSDPVIRLPKGGGALHGIGEKFTPDIFTGTGNFTVPIALPAGRNGFQPRLNLAYSTGNGNGVFGLGWGLSIPGISRKTSEGVPRYDDDKDTFILSGSEDLIPVGGTDADREYRPRTEGLFAKILHSKSGATDHWEVQSQDGLKSYYGTPEQLGTDAAAIIKPSLAASPRIFSWKLTRTQDPFGNLIEYIYEADEGNHDAHHWKQPLLSEIRYVDFQDEQGDLNYLVRISFEYEQRSEDESDPFSEYRAGFEIRTTKRCKAIEITTFPALSPTPGPIRVRRYEFAYSNDSLNQSSLLTEIRVLGFADTGEKVQELPPLSFSYTSFDPLRRKFQAVSGRDLPPHNLGNPNYELVDLFGYGLPSVLEMNGQVRYWRNLGGGQFDLPRIMQEAPPFSLADPGVQIIDANGDGRPDLLVTSGLEAGYYPMQFDGRWNRKSFQRYRQAPSFDLKDPEVRLVDLDGNGVTDAIRSSTMMECFFNDRKEGWRPGQDHERRVMRRSLAEFPDINFSDPRVKWADMSGDGMQDIVLIHSGNVAYWPNVGRGDWGARIQMKNSPTLPWGYDPRRLLLGDVDGDGAADLLYVDDRQVTLWLNRQGNSWSTPIVIQGTPTVSDIDSVRLVDFHGTGVSGILWSRDADIGGKPQLLFLDFTGGIKPYLLSEMDNYLGAVTKVTYQTSSAYCLEDSKRPASRWRTTLPFPVQVVARVEINDAISNGCLTTEYRYHHGYWDGDEREFRGFGMVEQLDTETIQTHLATAPAAPVIESHFSPPILTKTWFHLGPVEDASGDDWHEMDWSDEWWSGDPPLLGHKEGVDNTLRNIQAADPSLTRRDRRHALRALRGSVLRTEIYALDATEREAKPYTVTESAYELAEVTNPLLADQPDLKRIFFPHLVVQRTTQWERGEDPLTVFTFTSDYDEFGHPRQQTTVAAPRRSAKRKDVECSLGKLAGDVINETQALATHTRTQYATPDPGLYLFDRVCQARSFELTTSAKVQETNPDYVIQVLRDQFITASKTHETFAKELQDWQPGQPLPQSVRLFTHTVNHYDGAAFAGREDARVGPYGALTRSETLVLTETELQSGYETGFAQTRRPVYLGGDASLADGAPANFGSNAGYTLYSDDPTGHHAGYYVDTQRQQFDFQASPDTCRGLLIAKQDALGDVHDLLDRTTHIHYDVYGLLPIKTVDPAGLETTAEINYRVMQPGKMVEPNGNTTNFRYSPSGLLQKQWLLNRDGTEGGSEEKPENEFSYDFRQYEKTRNSVQPQPIYAHSRQRERHALDPLDPHPPETVIEAREFSDGFGRVIQKRAQADDILFGAQGNDVGLPLNFSNPTTRDLGNDLPPAKGERVADTVVVSGWQVYDNKGRVVEKCEPFFSTGWEFATPLDNQIGAKVTMYYDPRGQVIRTVNPDQTEQRVLFGIPATLDAPDDFEPTPWESYIYDASDLGTIASSIAVTTAAANASHLFTPTNQLIDALGRVRCSIQRNGESLGDAYLTQSSYDIRGNLLSITDSLGRVAFTHNYDLLNRPLRITSIDAGARTSVFNAIGALIEYRDSKGSIVLHEYDILNRPTRLWALNDSSQTSITLREQINYGDGGTRTQPTAEREANWTLNRLGRPKQHYDEAGLTDFRRYDFKGNLIEKARRVISDTAIANGWTAHWSDPNAESDLEPEPAAFQTDSRFDALNRLIEMLFPQEAKPRPEETGPHRAKLTPHYNRAGALQAVELDGAPYVSHMAHNARGQRLLIAYGAGVMTRYAYDPLTFRLARLRSERFQEPVVDSTFQGTGEPLQDFIYRYDPSGNIVTIEERVKSCGVENSLYGRDRLIRDFKYDAIYRLLSATGRACAGRPERFFDSPNCGSYQAPFLPGSPIPNQDNAPSVTELYRESYNYDPAGNMLELDYDITQPGGAARLWARRFGIGGLPPDESRNAPNNRLTTLRVGGIAQTYAFDDNGNLLQLNLETFHTWDHADRMIGYRVQNGANPTKDARYLYGADGIRVKKWFRNDAGQIESTVYVDEVFEQHTWTESGSPIQKQNNYLHMLDGQSRIALIRVGDQHEKDASPPVQYHLGDHLGSSAVVISDSGAWINREEFFPYGETSFGSFARKRYRFTGKERDEESGLNYHGARYFSLLLIRWISCDPLFQRTERHSAKHDYDNCHQSLYTYAAASPLRFRDTDGLQNDDLMREATQAIDALRTTLTTASVSHAITQATQEAALGEAQGATIWGSLQPFQHLENVKQSANAIGNGLTRVREALTNLSAIDSKAAKEMENASSDFMRTASSYRETLKETVERSAELRANYGDRLADVRITITDRATTFSERLVGTGRQLVPDTLRNTPTWRSYFDRVRELPKTLAQVGPTVAIGVRLYWLQLSRSVSQAGSSLRAYAAPVAEALAAAAEFIGSFVGTVFLPFFIVHPSFFKGTKLDGRENYADLT